MKVNSHIRGLFQSNVERYQRLRDEVRDLLKARAEERNWFFIDRIKREESFALKLETGRVPEPANAEDFYACRIVVPTLSEIPLAEDMVLAYFDLKERRPPDDTITPKNSSDFRWDDLRLYVARRVRDSGRNDDLTGMVFEAQVETVLQYAWSIATHDLIYKTDSVNWQKERIAFQIKAMLEHAEVAITSGDRLVEAAAISKTNADTAAIVGVIKQVETFWSADVLPDNRKRLAENLLVLLGIAGVSWGTLADVLETEQVRCGTIPLDLSPYAFLLQALVHRDNAGFEKRFRNQKRSVLVHGDMDVPEWMRKAHPRIINVDAPK